MARSPVRLAVPLAALLLAACSGGPSPSPQPSPIPSPPEGVGFLLRVTMVQALPPGATFGTLPMVVVTTDGRLLTGGAIDMMYPGPLVMPVVQRSISAAGWDRIVSAGRELGLLTGAVDFTGGQMPPGSAAARLQMVVDGRLFELTGDPSRVVRCGGARCIPTPGTPEAFAAFVAQLVDPTGWLGPELGPQAVMVPTGYALLVGPPPVEEPQLSPPPVDWPLAAGLKGFGKPLADGSGKRCGVVGGADAATIAPLLGAARSLQRWRDASDGSLFGLTVRPLLPGDDDPCAGLV